MRPSRRQLLPLTALLAATAMVAMVSVSDASTAAAPSPAPPTRTLPRFHRVVFLSHVNDPARTPVFPGDPEFTLTTAFTVPDAISPRSRASAGGFSTKLVVS